MGHEGRRGQPVERRAKKQLEEFVNGKGRMIHSLSMCTLLTEDHISRINITFKSPLSFMYVR